MKSGRLTNPNSAYKDFKNHKLQQYENTGLSPTAIDVLRAQLQDAQAENQRLYRAFERIYEKKLTIDEIEKALDECAKIDEALQKIEIEAEAELKSAITEGIDLRAALAEAVDILEAYIPPLPPMLDGETAAQYTDRLTGADGTGRVPYKERRFRQCSIGYHGECTDPEGKECKCPCHQFEQRRKQFLSKLPARAAGEAPE